MISSYAYFLSLFPETADGMRLMRGFKNMDTSNLPISHEELQNLRLRLGLDLPTENKKDV
jgi:hypothetical protein